MPFVAFAQVILTLLLQVMLTPGQVVTRCRLAEAAYSEDSAATSFMRTLTYCRLVIAVPKFEGNHGPNLLEIAVKGHCFLQLNPKNRRERMGLSDKLTLEVGSTLLVQTCRRSLH